MVKIGTPNKQGQIVIPIEFRKKFNINQDSYLEFSLKDDFICVKPLEVKRETKDCFDNFPKLKQRVPFNFKSKNPSQKNLAREIDDILYQ